MSIFLYPLHQSSLLPDRSVFKGDYNINYHIVWSVKYRRKMYEKFLRQQLWKGELWNHSYYLETIGDISEETIRKYIEHQSKQY